ncbi:MAG: ornithine cyclodeaminase family protein [Gemmatimonadota bacterium]|nr:MAG: ornithine cyclodeaminase family protein [Gemmatimonadota bacterium]
MSVLIINQAEVHQLLLMEECIELMHMAFRALAQETAIAPLRPIMKLPDKRGVVAMMPGYSSGPEALAVKIIAVYPGNLGTAYDSHQGAVLLFDVDDGRLLSLIDASEVTAIRTAAASAVATELLAHQTAEELAILGSGVQARTHLEAMLKVRNIKRVRIWSRTAERAHAFAEREQERFNVEFEVVSEAKQAVLQASLICTTTAAREPVLLGEWLSSGTHVNAVGSASPVMRELDTAAIRNARLFVDSRESAKNEAGDFLIPLQEGAITDDHIVAEIGEILEGSAPGRTHDDETTVFKSLGVGIQDVLAADHIYAKAKDLGMGTEVDLGGLR